MADNNERENVFTLTDEDGNESDFELVGELTLDGVIYLALTPVDGDDDEYGILKVTVDENGDELLITIDDNDEFERVADAFEDTFMEEYDLDAPACDDDSDEEYGDTDED